jgi:hypothetical protein
VTENWSALQERLSWPGGGDMKLDAVSEFQVCSLVVGL